MTAIASIVTNAFTSVQPMALPLIGIALFIAGIYWGLIDSNHGKGKAIAALVGGAIAFNAAPIATALAALH